MTNHEKKFDIAILGSGPGGYVAAIRAAQLGAKTALIEADHLGGTCLNRGCIPTKALIANASVWQKIKEAHLFGIEVQGAKLNYAKMYERKERVVHGIRENLEKLIRTNKIEIIQAYGRLRSRNEVKLFCSQTDTPLDEIYAEKIILATGSEPLNIPAFPFDGIKIHSSTSILQIQELPKEIVIIGGGYIGCEFASMFAELGCKVTIVEALDRIIVHECKESSHFLMQEFARKGIDVKTSARVESIDTLDTAQGKGVRIKLEGEEEILESQIALVSIGRKLNIENIGLEKAGVFINSKGAVEVDDTMRTNIENIYAIGDITAKWLLAHTASHQGIVAANNACGRFSTIKYEAVPSVIFTDPEAASVGLHVDQAQQKGFKARAINFPFAALGKSQASMDARGFGQIVVEEKTGRILGAQVVGHEAGALIAEMALAIENELTVECVSQTIHAHPTISEIWLEAALMAENEPIHLPKKLTRS